MRQLQPHISSVCLALAVIAASILGSTYNNTAFAEESEFVSATVDMGIVVKDVEKSIKFYTEALGFTEIDGFSVPGGFCKDAGLTDGQPVDIRVVVLDKDDEKSTKIKLMQLPGVKSKKTDNTHIHSQLGFSYLTIYVQDTNAAIARLTKAKAKPIAKGPVGLPDPLPSGVFLTVVRDPDGNLIELVGPKK
ncbi:MAG: VOC family protein [Pirellulales bacterium]